MSGEDAESEDRLDRLEERVDRLEEAIRRLHERTAGQAPASEPEPSQAPSTVEAQPRVAESSSPEARPASLEERIGADLLAKVGVIVLVLGLAFFVAWAIETGLMGLVTRIVLGVLAGLSAVAIAHPFRDSPRYGRLARVIAGGGFALAYFCVFAAHHFPEYQAAIGIGFWTDTVLLTLLAVGAAGYGLHVGSPALLFESLVLGSMTAFLAHEHTVFTLVYATMIGLGVAGAAARLRASRVVAVALATIYGHAFVTHIAGEDPGTVLAWLAVDGILVAAFVLAIPKDATPETSGATSGRVVLYGANAGSLVAVGTLVAETGGVLDDGVFSLLAAAGLFAAAWPAKARSTSLMLASLLAGLGSLVVGTFLAFTVVEVVFAWGALYMILAVLVPLADRRLMDRTVHGMGVLVALATVNSVPELDPGTQRVAVFAFVALAYVVGFVAFKLGRSEDLRASTRAAVPHIAAATVALAMLIILELEGWRSTVALGGLGIVPVVAGFLVDWPEPRWAGLGLLGFALAKAFAVDVWALDPALRVVAFIGLGLALVAAAFAYARFSPEPA